MGIYLYTYLDEGARLRLRKREAEDRLDLCALLASEDVVPVHIVGRYGFRQRVTVVFGQPISLEEYQGQRLNTALLTQIADRIMGQVLALGDRVALPDGETGKE